MWKPASRRHAALTLWTAFTCVALLAHLSGQTVPAAPTQGAISGRVVDDRGDPVAYARVTAQDPEDLRLSGFVLTGPDGTYRMGPLWPSTYVVGVVVRRSSVPLPPSLKIPSGVAEFRPGGDGNAVLVDDDGRTFTTIWGFIPADALERGFFSTMYHGGAAGIDRATPVRVVPGQVQENVNIQVLRVPGVRVSGRVSGPSGPIAAAEVRLFAEKSVLEPLGSVSPPAAMAWADEEGRFTIAAVPPGTYLVEVAGSREFSVIVSPDGVPLRRGSDVIGNAMLEGLPHTTVVVGSEDVEDLNLVVKRHAMIRGIVIAPRPAPPVDTPLRSPIRLVLDRMSTFVRTPGAMPFAIGDVRPGRHTLRALNLPAGWSIMSIVLNGRNVMGQEIEVGDTDIDNLQVVLGNSAEMTGPVLVPGRGMPVVTTPDGRVRPGVTGPPPGARLVRPPLYAIAGRVTDAENRPVAGIAVHMYRLLVVNGVRQVAMMANGGVVTDAEGRYRIEEAPPGANFIAVQYPNGPAMPNDPAATAALPAARDADGVLRGYITTFYPETTMPSDARSVSTQGRDLTGVDIRLPRVPVENLTGVVTGAPRRMLVSVQPEAESDRAGMLARRIVQTNADGSFTVEGLAHGRYEVSVNGEPEAHAIVEIDGSEREPLVLRCCAR